MLKKISLKLGIKRSLKKDNTKRAFIPFEKASKIGIMVSNRQHYNLIQEFAQNLKKKNKQVTTLFFGKPNTFPQKKEDNILLSTKEINAVGKIKNPEAEKFIKSEFDFLFYLNTSPTLLLESILLASNAKCRVGFYDERNIPYCDMFFPVEDKNNIKKALKTVEKYIQTLK